MQFLGSFSSYSTVVEKSRIQETLNLSTDAGSITIAMKRKKNLMLFGPFFLEGSNIFCVFFVVCFLGQTKKLEGVQKKFRGSKNGGVKKQGGGMWGGPMRGLELKM